MLNKVLAILLFLIAGAILASLFFINPEPTTILAAIVFSFVITLFGVVVFRHGFKSALKASHKGQPDYLKFK